MWNETVALLMERPLLLVAMEMQEMGGKAIGDGSVANGNGNGQGCGVALNGGYTHPGCSDAIGSLCFNKP